MSKQDLKTFVHPHKVYRLEYPAQWENLQEDDAKSCGFGPHDRNNVGLWISIMPISLDTDSFAKDMPRMMNETMARSDATNVRPDPAIAHHALKADVNKEGQGGHYWIVAGGDVVLFASTQVPIAERDVWNPLFDRLMASLRITRDEELFQRRVANELMAVLREKHPDQEYEFEERGIRGRDRVIFLSNLLREVKAAPHRQTQIIRHFVEGFGHTTADEMGYEEWDKVKSLIVPVLKPTAYLKSEGPTQHILWREWLDDVIICYAIQNDKMYRFVTGWDVNRWGTTNDALHDLSIANLDRLGFPNRLEGSRQHDGGRLILIMTGDSLAASRLLHPDLHHLFSQPLGSPFWAGIPNRDTLVVYSDRKNLKQRMLPGIRKDHNQSAYQITPRPFLVTRDGIAPGS